ALSIAAGHAFELEVVRRVPPSAFRPPPRVDSVVVGLTPRAPSLKPEQEAAFMEHVKMLFTRRRKRMASGLNEHRERMGEAAWASLQERLGNSRAEEFTPAEHLEIFRMIHCLDA
ncbi:MAG: 16S ribosomal RNA methyltransferase A, partial [Deltaproteobacteria bacterium]|nr:16S ribosomal RNA methyltransferase A [Deltaproteobacteria bacterium]